MDPDLSPSRTSALRPALLVGLGLAVVAVAAGLIVGRPGRHPPPTAVAANPVPQTTPEPKPTFDIVRINRHGDAVMAGRAAPGAKVAIVDGGKVIGEATADSSGDWVFLPSARLAPGARRLTLTERMPNGAQQKGDRAVVLVVPPQGETGQAAEKSPALAVLTGPNVPPAILTGPQGSESAAGGQHLAVDAAEYGGHGKLNVTGTATPGATVRVYVDNRLAGQATAGANGTWSIANSGAIAPGDHHLRVDQLATNGTVASRVEQSFTRAQMELAAGRIRIAPGENLWTIARHTYGRGIRYLVIFQANRRSIRNPNLIYPGQVFALPASATAPATPASSSKSR